MDPDDHAGTELDRLIELDRLLKNAVAAGLSTLDDRIDVDRRLRELHDDPQRTEPRRP